MKSSVVFVLALLLCSGLVWAEDTTTQDGAAATEPAVEADGGGCMLPDLAGLSDEEARTALVKAGFDLDAAEDMSVPMCPTRFSCSSISLCEASSQCTLTDIGPCCSPGGGLSLCCLQGSIKVRRCPCQCTSFVCDIRCPDSTDVQWSCS